MIDDFWNEKVSVSMSRATAIYLQGKLFETHLGEGPEYPEFQDWGKAGLEAIDELTSQLVAKDLGKYAAEKDHKITPARVHEVVEAFLSKRYYDYREE